MDWDDRARSVRLQQPANQSAHFRSSSRNTLLNLFEDTEHNIWIGTQAGMVRLRVPVRTLSLPDQADSDAETIYQDRNGDVWVAAVNLYRIHNGRALPYQIPALAGVRVRNVFRDRGGSLWLVPKVKASTGRLVAS